MRKDRIYRGGGFGVGSQGMTEALDDLKSYFETAIVTKEQGEDKHWDLFRGNIYVDCLLVPDEQPITCRLTTVAGGPGRGVWMVPAVGTEVAVAFPKGSMENGGIIIAVLGSAQVPDGIEENEIVIVAPKVYIYNSDKAMAQPIPTLAEFKAHGHQTGTGPSAPTTDPIVGVGVITGTTVARLE